MNEEQLQTPGKMVQNGREVYKWATRTVPAGIDSLLQQTNLQKENIDWFVPHSANLRMIESICEKAEFPREKMLTSVEYYGNTSAVSIPLAFQLALKNTQRKTTEKHSYKNSCAFYISNGRKFASISARRGSKNGGRASFSPIVSLGSSVAKPGVSVESSNKIPFGSLK